jgi:hypothetical protein
MAKKLTSTPTSAMSAVMSTAHHQSQPIKKISRRQRTSVGGGDVPNLASSVRT